MSSEVCLKTLVDEERLDLAEQNGSIFLALRRPEIFDSKFAPLVRRLACACCRTVQDHLTEKASLEALDTIECFAYGHASFNELVNARNAAKLAARRVRKCMRTNRRACIAAEAVRDSGRNNAFEALKLCTQKISQAGAHAQVELCRIIRKGLVG
jgi:hypothetical protein